MINVVAKPIMKTYVIREVLKPLSCKFSSFNENNLVVVNVSFVMTLGIRLKRNMISVT